MLFSKAILFVALLSSTAAALTEEHLDLEVIVEGERKLFPLLPGTQCPTGHVCRARHSRTGVAPMISALKYTMKSPRSKTLAATLDWHELNNNLDTVVKSPDYCTRRNAMAKAAGLATGVLLSTVNAPAYAAETAMVQMGTDAGGLQFVPAKTKVCVGDSVKWVNNKGGPHNVVFDEDAIPAGVNAEKISMDDQLGEEGDSFVMKFDKPGDYAYYCDPHRGAGMNGMLVVA